MSYENSTQNGTDRSNSPVIALREVMKRFECGIDRRVIGPEVCSPALLANCCCDRDGQRSRQHVAINHRWPATYIGRKLGCDLEKRLDRVAKSVSIADDRNIVAHYPLNT